MNPMISDEDFVADMPLRLRGWDLIVDRAINARMPGTINGHFVCFEYFGLIIGAAQAKNMFWVLIQLDGHRTKLRLDNAGYIDLSKANQSPSFGYLLADHDWDETMTSLELHVTDTLRPGLDMPWLQ